ncbi:hypothetical protein AHAS_Ahas19G0258200 [Arachis hypogaea]
MTDVGMFMVREFYTNAWVTYKHTQGVNPDPKNRHTMVRGLIIEFSPESPCIYLPPRSTVEEGCQRLAVLLGRHDLKPVARGCFEFIQRSIIPTSNRSKVTVERAVMIRCIMLGNVVEVHKLKFILMEIPLLRSIDLSLERVWSMLESMGMYHHRSQDVQDHSAGGSLHMKKTLEEAHELIEMVANNQYMYTSERSPVNIGTTQKREVIEVDTLDAILAQKQAYVPVD